MRALQINPVTGYRESGGDYAFNSVRKQEFLRIAAEVIDKHHEYPNVGDLCNIIGITVRCFQNHLETDEKFGQDWHELELHGEATCLSDMYALRKKNPMYMFGWLRSRFPEKYDPTRKIQLTGDNSILKKVLEQSDRVFEAEIIPNAGIIITPSNQVDKSANDSGVKNDK